MPRVQFELDRREFHRGTLGTLFSYTLLGTLAACGEFPRAIDAIAEAWLIDMEDMAQAVKGHAIDQVTWQERAEALFARAPLAEVCAMLDYERLARRARLSDPRESGIQTVLPRVAGLPDPLTFGHMLFGLRRGQAIPPHGHLNMATGFLVLEGEFHGRHFERLEMHEDHWWLRPTIDQTFRVGMSSTISDFRDNVHWFVAQSARGFLFNVHVHRIDPSIDANGRVHLDPTAPPSSDGSILAPKLDAPEAFARFGGGRGLA